MQAGKSTETPIKIKMRKTTPTKLCATFPFKDILLPGLDYPFSSGKAKYPHEHH